MKKYFSRFSFASVTLFIISLLVYYVSLKNVRVADFINNGISDLVRMGLAWLSYPFPFSIFELLVIFSPLILIITVIIMIKKGRNTVCKIRSIVTLISVISIIFTTYIYTLGIGYHTTTLGKRIGIEEITEVRADELYSTANTVVEQINQLADSLQTDGSQTVMPYSFETMNEKLMQAYKKMNADFDIVADFTSRSKPVYFSTVMSDLQITGIYSFFTGEANVNIEYPDYHLPATAAHELAHQRGICRENEANFVAFLVCIYSDDEYIRYSGYLSLYEELASALYRTDKTLYYELRSKLSQVARSDISAANAVYNAHKDSILGKINERLNDAYLKANGTEGTVTYGYVVRLAVAYYRNNE